MQIRSECVDRLEALELQLQSTNRIDPVFPNLTIRRPNPVFRIQLSGPVPLAN
jgi:hypothetical protein